MLKVKVTLEALHCPIVKLPLDMVFYICSKFSQISHLKTSSLFIGYTPNQHLPNGHSPVSSFLKDQDITPKLTKNNSNRNSAPVFSFDKKVKND